MADFRNVENDGEWVAGSTYTFEVYLSSTEEFIGGNQLRYTGQTLIGDDSELGNQETWGPNGNLLYDNNSENMDGSIENTPYDNIEELEAAGDGAWFRFTITIPEDVGTGTFYLKIAEFDYTVEFG